MNRYVTLLCASFIYQVESIFSPYIASATFAVPSTITCTYKLTFRSDTTAKYLRTEYFSLIVYNSNSVFQSKRQLATDSIYSSYDSMPFSQEVFSQMKDAVGNSPKTEFSYTIYKDINNKKITYVDDIQPNKYSYTEPINLFTWNINSSVKTINGYNCQQATTLFRGRRFTAWFTRQVPVSEGPYKFSGLPGLIIKISGGGL